MTEKDERKNYPEEIGFLLIGFSIYELIFKRSPKSWQMYETPISRWMDAAFGKGVFASYSTSVSFIFAISTCLFIMQYNEKRFWKYIKGEDERAYRSYMRTNYFVYAYQIGLTVMAHLSYGFDNALCIALGFFFIDMAHA